MTKYFTKSESENIISLLKSRDKELIYLGFSLLTSHPKYKNFKKLIPYNEKRIYTFYSSSRKNCVTQEIKELKRIINGEGYGFYMSQLVYLIAFIVKRTKNYGQIFQQKRIRFTC